MAGIDLDAFFDLEGLDYSVSDDASLAVVVAPHCLAGERGASLTRLLKVAIAVRVAPRWRNMDYHAHA